MRENHVPVPRVRVLDARDGGTQSNVLGNFQLSFPALMAGLYELCRFK